MSFSNHIKVLFFLLLVSKQGFASPQVPDYIIYQGDTLPVYNLILEQYLSAINKPDQGSLFGLKFRGSGSLNCWRGYQAIYQIENDSLFLSYIINCGELRYGIDKESSQKRIEGLFKDKINNGKVYIDWYTGSISLRNGDILRWDGIFYKSFEKELLLNIERGKIQETVDVENYIDEPERIDRRYQVKISDILFEELKKIKWRHLEKFDCSTAYRITIGENGQVNKVAMQMYDKKEYGDNREYNYCVKTLLKALKDLRFDIIKQFGTPISEEIYLNIWITDSGELENWTH